LHGVLAHAEEIGEGTQIRSERDDRPDVEIAVCPAIPPVADSRRERVVDRRMA
jgi:hypothetical protein